MTPARAVVAALAFGYVGIRVFWKVTSQPWRILDPPWVDGVLKLVLWAAPAVFLAAWFARRPLREGPAALGFRGRAWIGYGFGILATLPMAVALILGGWPHFDLASVAGSVVFGPLGEEALFRGVLLMVLVSVGRWPVWVAILFSAVAFGIAHLYYLPIPVGQLFLAGGPFGAVFFDRLVPDAFFWIELLGLQMLGLVLGGVLFGWVAYRWRSLWPAIGLHAGINLWWDASAGPFGIVSVRHVTFEALPIAHAISVLLAIAITLRYTTPKDTKAFQMEHLRDLRQLAE